MSAAETFDTGHLDVGDGHVLHYEQIGRTDGAPVVYLHGGPGTGCGPLARSLFDGDRHRAVLLDQRAAGESTPHAADDDVHWDSIDMDHHVRDLEQLRTTLGIDRWGVIGLSWGTALATTYAERHAEHVSALVLGAVSMGGRRAVDWITVQMGRHFPEEWARFREHVPPGLRDRRLVEAYNELVMDPDPRIHVDAAIEWCRWEDRHVAIGPVIPDPRYDDARFRLAFARQVTHAWRNDCWLADGELLVGAGRLDGTPGALIHGRMDISSPLDDAWDLHHAWPGSVLHVVDDEGHGGGGFFDICRRELVRLVDVP